ncbi:MAG: hypothetical protein OHK0032_03450 [Thermodesulfovibrionales bacterium]
MALKKEIKEALLQADFDRVLKLALNNKRVFGMLTSFTYDKEALLCWRAIEAVGKAAGAIAHEDPQRVRNIIHRLIWSVSDESGGIGWGAPEMLGEIVVNCPDLTSDIPPIIISLEEDKIFLKGVLWALGRLANAKIGWSDGAERIIKESLDHPDPAVRGLSLWAASKKRIDGIEDRVAGMLNDNARFKFYEDHELKEMTVGEMAKRLRDDQL